MTQEELYNRIDMLRKLTSKKDWDDEGCEPFSDKLWELTIETIEVLQKNTTLGYPYMLSPCGDMTVHLTWVIDGVRHYVEVIEK